MVVRAYLATLGPILRNSVAIRNKTTMMLSLGLFLLLCGYAVVVSLVSTISSALNDRSAKITDWLIGLFWPLILCVLAIVLVTLYIIEPLEKWYRSRKKA